MEDGSFPPNKPGETANDDATREAEVAAVSPDSAAAADAVFQCLRVGGGISARAWADVSRVAWQVCGAACSLSLLKVCSTKWIYSRVASICCCSCVILSLFYPKVTHSWHCP